MSELESTNVDVITTKIKDSLDSRKNLVTQLKSLNKKRLDMRDEIITITSQLGEQQAVLEPLYGEAGKNRKERQGLLNEKKQIWTQINDKDDVIKQNESLSKAQNSKTDRKFNKKENTKNISKQIKEIEWKIQTAQLSRQEEKQLIKNITTLQKKYNISKKEYNIWKKSTTARKELSALFKKIKQIGTSIDTIDKSREREKASFYEKKSVFDTKFKQREQLFSEMNGFNDDIRELETTLKANSKELQLLKTQRTEIFKSIKSVSKSAILKKKKVILEKEKSKAKEKLESGQALSFDELRLAYDDDDEYLS